jgi:predicted metal-dependent hydrolase
LKTNAHRDVRVHVGATAATEHLTALFADWMMRHPEALAGSEPRLQTLWLWHCAEESEHRSTAFDMFKAIHGSEDWRVRIFRYMTFTFLSDVMRQTVRNLWHDGSLFRWSTWRSAYQLLLSRDGMIRGNYVQWCKYMQADFHPRQTDGSLAAQWLTRNNASFAPVGPAT